VLSTVSCPESAPAILTLRAAAARRIKNIKERCIQIQCAVTRCGTTTARRLPNRVLLQSREAQFASACVPETSTVGHNLQIGFRHSYRPSLVLPVATGKQLAMVGLPATSSTPGLTSMAPGRERSPTLVSPAQTPSERRERLRTPCPSVTPFTQSAPKRTRRIVPKRRGERRLASLHGR
jgi:hypothetical protein